MQQRTDEWLTARKGRVTASLAGALLGLSPFMTREKALAIVAGVASEPENRAMAYGSAREKDALGAFRFLADFGVEPCGFIAKDDWAGASPDGLIGDDALLEIKCPFALRDDAAPAFKPLAEQAHYYAQVQFQLWCADRERAFFFQWAPGDCRLETVARDEEWIARNIPALRQAWAEAMDLAKDDGAPIAGMAAEWDALGADIERLTERRKEVLSAMVTAAGGKPRLLPDGRTLKEIERAGAVQWAKLANEKFPDIDPAPYRGAASRYWTIVGKTNAEKMVERVLS